VLEELSRQTRVLYRDHDEDDERQEEDNEDSGVPEEDSEHDVEETIRDRLEGSKAGRTARTGSVVDPLVEMAEEVVDGETGGVFKT
jgi:hypothetical protein